MKTQKKTMAMIAICILTLGINSCQEKKSNQTEETEITGDKLDLEPLKKKILTESKNFSNSNVSKNFTANNQIPQTRNELEKMRTIVQIYDGSTNVGITLAGFGGAKLGKSEKSMNVYYLETKVVVNGTDSIVYGCGYSIHYLFKKVEGGIDISNIPNVAASAQLKSNKTQVFYSMQTYGAIGKSLAKFFKPTVNKNFNVEGFGVMQSSIDGIHNILTDDQLSVGVTYKPEMIKFIKPYELQQ